MSIAIYRQIMVPTEKDHNISLPEELYGLKVEILAFPIEEETHYEAPALNPDLFYDTIKLDFSGFKFNRDQANEIIVH